MKLVNGSSDWPTLYRADLPSQYPQPLDRSSLIPFLRCNIQLYLHHHPRSYDLDRHGSLHDIFSRRRILLYLQCDLPYGHMSLARSEPHSFTNKLSALHAIHRFRVIVTLSTMLA